MPAAIVTTLAYGTPRLLGGDHRAEVGLVADDDVRPPVVAERCDQRRPLVREPVGEAVAEVARLPLGVELLERDPLRRLPGRLGRKRLEAALLDDGEDRRSSREGDGMAGGAGGLRRRQQRLDVPAPAGEGEQDPHVVTLSRGGELGSNGQSVAYAVRSNGQRSPSQRETARRTSPSSSARLARTHELTAASEPPSLSG